VHTIIGKATLHFRFPSLHFCLADRKKAFSVVVVSNVVVVVVVVVLLWSVRATTLFHAHWKFAFISYASSDRTIGRPPDLPNRFSVLEVFAKFLVFL